MSRLIKIGGALLTTASFGFIFYQFWDQAEVLREWRPSQAMIVATASAALAYATTCLLLTSAWVRLLRLLGADPDPKAVRSIYARTQLAKYLPGNVLHIAGRHVLSRSLGLSHGQLATASLLEVIGLGIAAMALTLVGGALADLDSPPFIDNHVLLFAALAVVTGLVLLGVARRIGLLRRFGLQSMDRRKALEALSSVLARYFAFFVLVGIILVLMAETFGMIDDHGQAGTVVLVFAIAWMAGFVTPGAPSGLGVREAVMVALLTPILGASNSLVVALAFRLATTLGDVIFALVQLPRNQTNVI